MTISYGGKTCQWQMNVLKTFNGCVQTKNVNVDYDGKGHSATLLLKGDAAIGTSKITYSWENDITGKHAGGLTKMPVFATPGIYLIDCYIEKEGYMSEFFFLRVEIRPGAVKNITKKLIGHDDIQLTWDAARGANMYRIYIKRDNGSYSLYGTVNSTSTTKVSKKIYNLYDGRAYSFAIAPCIKLNANGYISRSVKAYTGKLYTLKQLGTPKVYKNSRSYVRVAWSNIYGETGYQISRSVYRTKTNIVKTYKTTAGKSSVVKATRGRTYYYKVRAYKIDGGKYIYGPWSAVRAYKLR